jgi:hypothetical protein
MSDTTSRLPAGHTVAAVKVRHHLLAEILLGAFLGGVVALLSGSDWRFAVAIGVLSTAVLRPIRRWSIGGDKAVPFIPSPRETSDSANRRSHVICLDGTWNSRGGTPSNVLRLFKMLEEDSQQIKRYYPGVGTRDLSKARSAWVNEKLSNTLLGGGTGVGHYGAVGILLRAYFDFVKTYRPGDRVFIFGFSRGATIARALANYICKTHGLPESVEIEYLKSRIQADTVLRLSVSGPARYFPPIEFVGLWDTVVSMPDRKDIEPVEFDISIPPLVKNVCHLVAIHEARGDFFDVALVDHDERVEEIWFPGWHSNVGGGCDDARLSNIALRYMMTRARGAGLRFATPPDTMASELKAGDDFATALWDPDYWRLARLASDQREIRVSPPNAGVLPKVHESAYTLKQLYPLAYDPPTLPDRTQVEVVSGFAVSTRRAAAS